MPTASSPDQPAPAWTFFTNHAHVLLCIAQDPAARVRDLAAQVGITERAVQRIITELEQAGYLSHVRDGRRNRYEVHPNLPLRHPIERHRNVAELIALVHRPAPVEDPAPSKPKPRAKTA
jgi:DNA-binding transcriptional ArsR family regulator